MSKYHNVKTEVSGITFASKREAHRYSELLILCRSKIISNLRLQPKYPIQVNGVKICTYIGDFAYLDQQGREVLEDVKGVRTAVYSMKAKLMIAVYGLRIVEVQ